MGDLRSVALQGLPAANRSYPANPGAGRHSPVGAKPLRPGHAVMSASHVGGRGKRHSDKGGSWAMPSETLL
jgi:hypothetical protein